MFGWRRRSEGFEWKEYVRTTVLVRRADRQRRVEDVRAAAVEKVKNAADAGAEAGRASVSFMGSQFSKFLWALGEALLDFAAAIASVLLRWSKFFLAIFRTRPLRSSQPPLGCLAARSRRYVSRCLACLRCPICRSLHKSCRSNRIT